MRMSEWAAWFTEASDSDPVIAAQGRGFSCAYLLDMGSARAIIKMVEGRVHRIIPEPGSLEPYDFAFRGSGATWREISRAVPEPGCQGLFAAAATRDFRIEGDMAVLMRNLGNVTRQFELLRVSGVPL